MTTLHKIDDALKNLGFPLDEEDIEELCSHLPIDGKHFKYPEPCKDFFYFSVEISEVYLLISWKKPEAYREQILKNRDILFKKKFYLFGCAGS